MIVLDSSVLVGIIRSEDEAERFLDLLAANDYTISAPTLVETRAWCAMNLTTQSSRWLEDYLSTDRATVAPFGRDMADIASREFATFGKASGHPAKLNFGDCMAYAVATALRAPLLFKGGDFGRTDVLAHPSSSARDRRRERARLSATAGAHGSVAASAVDHRGGQRRSRFRRPGAASRDSVRRR